MSTTSASSDSVDEDLVEQRMCMLDHEIEHLLRIIEPSDEDQARHEQVMKDVVMTITGQWPNARVELYGSRATGLAMPDSDFDFEVWDLPPSVGLKQLKKALIRHNVCEPGKTLVIKAKVPIVKFVHRPTRYEGDIRLGDVNKRTIQITEMIREYCERFKMLRPLYVVTKQLLVEHDLNNASNGGLPSYALLLMCIGFLELETTQPESMATCFLEFLRFYGIEFDYSTAVVYINHGGRFIKEKKSLAKKKQSYLFIEDPFTPGVNKTKHTKRAPEITDLFARSYDTLQTAIFNKEHVTNVLCCILTLSGL